MASQPPSDSVTVEMGSFVRRDHSYMDVWEPQIGKVLALEREPQNIANQFAVLAEVVVLLGMFLSNWLPYFLTS